MIAKITVDVLIEAPEAKMPNTIGYVERRLMACWSKLADETAVAMVFYDGEGKPYRRMTEGTATADMRAALNSLE